MTTNQDGSEPVIGETETGGPETAAKPLASGDTATQVGNPADTAPASAPADTAVQMPDLASVSSSPSTAGGNAIDLLKDVELNVKIELGRAKMYVEDVLKLVEGSVVELDKLAGDPVDIFVNERLVARGEVLVLNDNFCVRVNQIVSDVL
jgi:flagellar motor switch protein FliN